MYRLSSVGLLVAVALTAPVSAQQPPATPADKVIITKADCQKLVRHVPAGDVTYKPGVDVHGRAVAPADLPGSGGDMASKMVPDVIEFPINIIPMGYGQRNAANKQKSDALAGQSTTAQSLAAAQGKLPALNSQKTTLQTKAATLASQLTSLQTTLAGLQAKVDAKNIMVTDPQYVSAKSAVAAKNAEISANSLAIATNSSDIAAQQAIVNAAPGQTATYQQQQNDADSKLAGISSRGMDMTTATVGAVKYDIRSNTFTFNGQPLGSPDEQAVAEQCRKQGVR